jgi:hypothetical protein
MDYKLYELIRDVVAYELSRDSYFLRISSRQEVVSLHVMVSDTQRNQGTSSNVHLVIIETITHS